MLHAAVPLCRRSDTKKELSKDLIDDFPGTRVLEAGGSKDNSQLLWTLVNQKRGGLKWRDRHAYMLAQNVAWTPDPTATAAAAAAADGAVAPVLGTMTVQAYVRGKALDPNRLVYLPGAGAFQVGRIDINAAAKSHGGGAKGGAAAVGAMDASGAAGAGEVRCAFSRFSAGICTLG
jgi:hypothetical protein